MKTKNELKSHCSNIIEVIRKYGESEDMCDKFVYFSMFVLDEADNMLFEAIEIAKKEGLYKQENKHLLSLTYKTLHSLVNRMKQYLDDDWDTVLDRLDKYHDIIEKNMFVLYNTVLSDSAKLYFGNYERRKMCSKIDTTYSLISFWIRCCNRIAEGLPFNHDYNDWDMEANNVIKSCRNFIARNMDDKDNQDAKLTDMQASRFKGAFMKVTDTLLKIYTDMMNL